MQRPAAWKLAALALLAACAAPPATAVRPGVPLDSAPMATAAATIEAAWTQTLTGTRADVYLFAPGDPGRACHAATTASGLRFHCEGHAGWIVVEGFDPAAPHEVTVRLMRGANRSGLTVSQGGRPLPQSQASVPGAPQVPAGGRLRLQLAGEATLSGPTVSEAR